MLVKLTHIS